MHYVDEGRGDPVLMVHGNPSWSFYYRDLINQLREHHRVIAHRSSGVLTMRCDALECGARCYP